MKSIIGGLAALTLCAVGVIGLIPSHGTALDRSGATLRPLPADSAQEQIFRAMCASCHGAAPIGNIPDRGALAQRTPEQIFTALTSGQMRSMAQGLTPDQIQALSLYLSERRPVE